jgi:hypothetical protein
VKLLQTVALLLALAALAGGTALAAKPPQPPGHQRKTTTTTSTQPGQSEVLPTQAKAYGRYCQGQSKRHIAGQQGTPFSQCVTAMAKAGHGQTPKSACASMSKKHVPGEKGTPFSRCVVAAAHLQRDQHQQNAGDD